MLDSKRMRAHVAWVNCYKPGAPAGELSGHCTTLCSVLPSGNTPSPCRVLIPAAFLLTAYKTPLGKPQALGMRCHLSTDDTQLSIFCRICRQPLSIPWLHTKPHCTKLLTLRCQGNNFQETDGCYYNSATEKKAPVTPCFSNSLHLLGANGPCPRDLAGISSQQHLATEGDLRELCCGKESSSIPHWYFLSQIHPFRMNWWTSYILHGNPLRRTNGCEHYSCRNLPGHFRASTCLLLPFLHAEGTGCCQESFWLSVPRLRLGIWVPEDHVFSYGALVTEFASSHSLPIFKFGVFKGGSTGFCACCLS